GLGDAEIRGEPVHQEHHDEEVEGIEGPAQKAGHQGVAVRPQRRFTAGGGSRNANFAHDVSAAPSVVDRRRISQAKFVVVCSTAVTMISYPRVASFRSASSLARHLAGLGWTLPFDDQVLTAPASPLAEAMEIPWHAGAKRIGNRFAVQPMEGWDGEPDGRPSELTFRRWQRFG